MNATNRKANTKIIKRAKANNPTKEIKWKHKKYATNSKEGRIKGKREQNQIGQI